MSWRLNHSALRRFLAGGTTAGNVEDRTGGERTLVRRQPADERGDLLDLDEAAHRNLREHVLRELGRDLVKDRRLRRGGRHAVDQHAGLGKLLAERLGERDQSALGRSVGGRVGIAFLAGDRGDVDDAAVAGLHHVRYHGAAAEKRAIEVDIDDALPLAHRIVDDRHARAGDTGVIDQHVDASELGDGSLYSAVYRRLISDVDARLAVEIPDCDFRARCLQALGDRGADALHAAGDDRSAAGEIELVHGDAKYNRCPLARI